MQADRVGLQDARAPGLSVRHVPHLADGQVGRGKSALRFVTRIVFDCKKIFEAERYGNCSIARCFPTENGGVTSIFFWTVNGTAQIR